MKFIRLLGFNPRSALAFGHDVSAAGAAWVVAFWLRFNLEIPAEFQVPMWTLAAGVMALDSVFFWRFGLYRGLWRYASIHDLRQILLAVSVAAVSFPAALMLLQNKMVVPRSVYILHPLILMAAMCGSRLAYRAWKERHIGRVGSRTGKPVLIVGAGAAALTLLKDLATSLEWRVIGLLDDDPTMRGRQILGVPVLGRIADLPTTASRFGVGHAIIAMPSASHAVRRRVFDLCKDRRIAPLTVPSFDDLMTGRVGVSQIRDVELDDLLGRDPVELDSGGLRQMIEGRAVMVTGAGGSIGSELCRQIARFRPSLLMLFDISEYALYKIEQEFRVTFPAQSIVPIVGDVRNRARVQEVMGEFPPAVVFHAAAYKHVPLMEEENAWEAASNNAFGTYILASVARECGVERFVLISTDKAVNPTNIMGASKRLAEMICGVVQKDSQTTFVVVRFGNVLGSTGSVIPKFREQISRGGPITVTHPEITRYFMSIPEAAQLVLQACQMGSGGEIFVLDMGEPVKIVDLAKELIRLSGLSEGDIAIQFTGLRPGEKLYEELLAAGENTVPTRHEKLRIARTRDVHPDLVSEFLNWIHQGPIPSKEVRDRLRSWIPEYEPAVLTGAAQFASQSGTPKQ